MIFQAEFLRMFDRFAWTSGLSGRLLGFYASLLRFSFSRSSACLKVSEQYRCWLNNVHLLWGDTLVLSSLSLGHAR